MSLHLVLYVVAAVCFALAAFGVSSGRVGLVPAGLFCWVLTLII
jgi:hypothetical protein